MTILRIRLRNFKSFHSLDLRLSRFNVVIGANASGKSNLISLLTFLRAIPQIGFLGAVRAHGGQALLKNIRSGSSIVEIEVVCRNPLSSVAFAIQRPNRRNVSKAPGFLNSGYRVVFDLGSSSRPLRVISERLSVSFSLPGRPKSRVGPVPRKVAGIVLRRDGTRIRLRSWGAGSNLPQASAFIAYLSSIRRLPIVTSVSLIDNPTTRPFAVSMFPDLFNGALYSLEPKREKELATPLAPPTLSVDGSNLAVVISGILQDPQEKLRLLSTVRDFLPFLKDIRVRDLGSSLLLEALEAQAGRTYLPAGALSDGTVNVLSLAVALNFERRPLIIVEEPERCIHPQLLGRVVDVARSLSGETQVIITTHNPEVVRHAAVDSLILLTRDSSGNSSVARPANNSRVKDFLREKIGVSDLFLLNQLS